MITEARYQRRTNKGAYERVDCITCHGVSTVTRRDNPLPNSCVACDGNGRGYAIADYARKETR